MSGNVSKSQFILFWELSSEESLDYSAGWRERMVYGRSAGRTAERITSRGDDSPEHQDQRGADHKAQGRYFEQKVAKRCKTGMGFNAESVTSGGPQKGHRMYTT